jgi:hypothetical protein
MKKLSETWKVEREAKSFRMQHSSQIDFVMRRPVGVDVFWISLVDFLSIIQPETNEVIEPIHEVVSWNRFV